MGWERTDNGFLLVANNAQQAALYVVKRYDPDDTNPEYIWLFRHVQFPIAFTQNLGSVYDISPVQAKARAISHIKMLHKRATEATEAILESIEDGE